MNVASQSVTFIFHVAAYLHGESSDSSGVDSWILLVLPVHQSVLGDEPIGPTWFTPGHMGGVGPCQNGDRVRHWALQPVTVQPLEDLPVGVAVGGAMFSGLACKV